MAWSRPCAAGLRALPTGIVRARTWASRKTRSWCAACRWDTRTPMSRPTGWGGGAELVRTSHRGGMKPGPYKMRRRASASFWTPADETVRKWIIERGVEAAVLVPAAMEAPAVPRPSASLRNCCCLISDVPIRWYQRHGHARRRRVDACAEAPCTCSTPTSFPNCAGRGHMVPCSNGSAWQSTPICVCRPSRSARSRQASRSPVNRTPTRLRRSSESADQIAATYDVLPHRHADLSGLGSAHAPAFQHAVWRRHDCRDRHFGTNSKVVTRNVSDFAGFGVELHESLRDRHRLDRCRRGAGSRSPHIPQRSAAVCTGASHSASMRGVDRAHGDRAAGHLERGDVRAGQVAHDLDAGAVRAPCARR